MPNKTTTKPSATAYITLGSASLGSFALIWKGINEMPRAAETVNGITVPQTPIRMFGTSDSSSITNIQQNPVSDNVTAQSVVPEWQDQDGMVPATLDITLGAVLGVSVVAAAIAMNLNSIKKLLRGESKNSGRTLTF